MTPRPVRGRAHEVLTTPRQESRGRAPQVSPLCSGDGTANLFSTGACMAAAHDVEALLAQLGSAAKVRGWGGDETTSPRTLSLSWPELEAVLPDGGLPRGVVELAAPRALGGSTSVALAAVRAGQARGASAWCAWLDPEATLHAPGVVASGVKLARMLVARVPRPQLGRVAVKVVASGAFEVVVVDFDAVPGAGEIETRPRPRGQAVAVHKQWAPEILVRKLALAAEPTGATVLLLTDVSKPRAIPWPVSLRVELSRPSPRELVVRVAKDKRGRIGLAKIIPFCCMAQAAV
jgi:hypothetical protein